MEIFINGLGNISPQQTLDNDCFLEEIVNEKANQLSCVEPEYKSRISPRYLRRMSRSIKMGVFAAKICLENANLEEHPDAIITGTGLGCIGDTEKFLKAINENEEGIISPTTFIQSTHNTVSAQIALMLKCNSYNFTYTHRGFSFESAVFDALLQFQEEKAKNILIGGIDEITETYLSITNRLKQWKSDPIHQLDLLKDSNRGSIAGEGAAFFMLARERAATSYAKIRDVQMIYKPKSAEKVKEKIEHFLAKNGLSMEELDLVLLGLNGNSPLDRIYHQLNENLFKEANKAYFKHLCGEYKTASSFALWLATQVLHTQNIPNAIKLNEFKQDKIKHVLIYNNYSNINHSLFLLQQA